MKVVYKYPLQVINTQEVRLLKNHKILCVKNQYDEMVLYVEVNLEEEEYETVTIAIVGTGHTFIDTYNNLEYIDTVLIMQDQLVWHVYKILE